MHRQLYGCRWLDVVSIKIGRSAVRVWAIVFFFFYKLFVRSQNDTTNFVFSVTKNRRTKRFQNKKTPSSTVKQTQETEMMMTVQYLNGCKRNEIFSFRLPDFFIVAVDFLLLVLFLLVGFLLLNTTALHFCLCADCEFLLDFVQFLFCCCCCFFSTLSASRARARYAGSECMRRFLFPVSSSSSSSKKKEVQHKLATNQIYYLLLLLFFLLFFVRDMNHTIFFLPPRCIRFFIWSFLWMEEKRLMNKILRKFFDCFRHFSSDSCALHKMVDSQNGHGSDIELWLIVIQH